MNLDNGLASFSEWDIHETAFDSDRAVTAGSNFMTGNGYMGYRGTLPDAGREDYAALVLTDTYDNADGVWSELSTLPNPVRLEIGKGGRVLDWAAGDAFTRGLDLSTGEWYARTEHRADNLVVEARRFASYADLHLLAFRFSFRPLDEAKPAARFELTLSVDTDVWNLNGAHLERIGVEREDTRFLTLARTQERKTGIALHGIVRFSGLGITEAESGHLLRLEGGVPGSDGAALEVFVGVYGANDIARETELHRPYRAAGVSHGPDRPVPDTESAGARDVSVRAAHLGYDAALEKQRAAWQELWQRFDVGIDGDEAAQLVARFNTYHGVIATPLHTDHLPIGARGLSCQAYQGAAFWDQEIFNLPMYLYTLPEAARSILVYRHRTIDGARSKATALGYKGAFYAWVSGDSGEEICPSYFFRDVISGRRIRNHFNDWQIHISPDIVYTIARYVEVTGDRAYLYEHGAEIVFEVARFLVSRSHLRVDTDSFEIIRVLGPDEYHENVDNNAFTNYQARFAVAYAIKVALEMERDAADVLEVWFRRLSISPEERSTWQRYVDRLYVPEPDEETLLIEQFKGFFDYEDITPQQLRERLIDPGEYWGWPNGIAVETQVSKQADVLQLAALHPNAFRREVLEANWRYYERRTQHGSSLSPAVHATTAARLGLLEEAEAYFWKASTVDIYNTNRAVSGGTFIGGIHTAACGAVWDILITGFAGMRADEEGLSFRPHLPPAWKRLSFFVTWRGMDLFVEVTPRVIAVRADGDGTVSIVAGDSARRVSPGETVEIEINR